MRSCCFAASCERWTEAGEICGQWFVMLVRKDERKNSSEHSVLSYPSPYVIVVVLFLQDALLDLSLLLAIPLGY